MVLSWPDSQADYNTGQPGPGLTGGGFAEGRSRIAQASKLDSGRAIRMRHLRWPLPLARKGAGSTNTRSSSCAQWLQLPDCIVMALHPFESTTHISQRASPFQDSDQCPRMSASLRVVRVLNEHHGGSLADASARSADLDRVFSDCRPNCP
jgi:hypothetical protein